MEKCVKCSFLKKSFHWKPWLWLKAFERCIFSNRKLQFVTQCFVLWSWSYKREISVDGTICSAKHSYTSSLPHTSSQQDWQSTWSAHRPHGATLFALSNTFDHWPSYFSHNPPCASQQNIPAPGVAFGTWIAFLVELVELNLLPCVLKVIEDRMGDRVDDSSPRVAEGIRWTPLEVLT